MPLSFPAAYERILDVKNSPKEGLKRMDGMLAPLGHPERRTPCIHIAGTNGKGSTAAFCDAVLRAHGHRVGRSTSPHLASVRERIAIDGAMITEAEFVRHEAAIFEAVAPLTDRPTFFERMCAMTFLSFVEHDVDLGVVEVGLGGRLDGTNVIEPRVSVITPISLDHTQFLGGTLAAIAREKAGIIKPGRPVVIGRQPDEARAVLLEVARERAAPVIAWGAGLSMTVQAGAITAHQQGRLLVEDARPSLRGAHQAHNAAVACAACAVALGDGYDPVRARAGLAATTWPGRYETVAQAPRVLLDGAHNPDGARVLRATLDEDQDLRGRPLALVVGATRGHDVTAFARSLGLSDTPVWCSQAGAPRSIPAGDVAAGYRAAGYRHLREGGVGEALSVAQRHVGPAGAVLVTGSLYLVGEVRHAVCGGAKDPALAPF